MTISMIALFILIATPSRASEVQWAAVESGGYSASVRVSGRVVAQEGALSVESARVQGRVTKILRREGERVAVGDALFVVSSPECLSLANEKRVAESRGLSDLIEAAVRREEQLGLRVSGPECRLISSHDGTLAKRHVELGAAFNLGDALATILDISKLSIELDVPERNLSHVRPGQHVRAELASALDHTIKAEIDSILPTIDPATRAGRVRLKALALPAGTTMDALAFAEIDIGVKRQAFKVPTAAIVFNRNRQYVLKKSGESAVPVPIDVLSESESVSTIHPAGNETLRLGDQIAVKSAIFLFKTIGNSLP